MQTKGLVGLTAAMLAALALLIGLGLWQLQRLHWKEGLIAQIEARTKGPPITLEDAVALAREGRDPNYYRIHVDGRFHHAKERYLYAVSDGRVGCPSWIHIEPCALLPSPHFGVLWKKFGRGHKGAAITCNQAPAPIRRLSMPCLRCLLYPQHLPKGAQS